jgi:hypothetical protein
MTFVDVAEAFDAGRGSLLEERLHVATQGWQVGFDRQKVIGALIADILSNGPVAGDGVDADDGAFQAPIGAEPRSRRNSRSCRTPKEA